MEEIMDIYYIHILENSRCAWKILGKRGKLYDSGEERNYKAAQTVANWALDAATLTSSPLCWSATLWTM